MGYELVLYLVMLFVFISYISFIWSKYGVLKSISQSYYELPVKWQPLFTLFCWGFAFPAIMIGVPYSSLMFFAGTGICFVGAAAAFQEKMTHTVHMVGAIGGVILSQLAIIINFGMWPISAAFVGASLLFMLFRKKLKYKQIWWIEILAFLSICYVLGTVIL